MVVERHKGRIDFTTAPGVGTTFRITLPVRTAG
jgi:signal transduction histidine kinase